METQEATSETYPCLLSHVVVIIIIIIVIIIIIIIIIVIIIINKTNDKCKTKYLSTEQNSDSSFTQFWVLSINLVISDSKNVLHV